MKKILFVFNHPAPYKVRLLNELSKIYDLTVIFERDSNKDRDKLFYSEKKYLFKTVQISGIKLGNENLLSFGIKSHLKHNSYDLVIMNGYSNIPELDAIKYLKRKHIPYILYINGGIIHKDESTLKRKIKTKYISGATAYMSPDLESNKYLVYYGADSKLIYNYVYSTIYKDEIAKVLTKEKKIQKRNDYGIKFKNVFVSSGQLIERKNYLGLLESWKKLSSDCGLYIFGEGPQRARISKYLNKNKINNVILFGQKPKRVMLDFFTAADAFVFPSKEDIYGHVINEALSQGIPVISSTKVNAALNLIKDGKNGYLVHDFSETSLIATLKHLENKNFSNDCIETAKQNTVEKMVETNIKIINEVLNK